jgi:hypothetical protein
MMRGLSGIELAVPMQQVCPDCRFSRFPGSPALRILWWRRWAIIRSSFSPNLWNRFF